MPVIDCRAAQRCISAMVDVSVSFAAKTASDLVNADVHLASLAPRSFAKLIDVEAEHSVAVNQYCSAGDRVIMTKVKDEQPWAVDALGSVISVHAINDQWGIMLDGPPAKAVLAPPSCFSVLGKDTKLCKKFIELGRDSPKTANVTTSSTRMYHTTREKVMYTPKKHVPVRSYDAVAGALNKGNMLVASSMDETLYVEGVSPATEVRACSQ